MTPGMRILPHISTEKLGEIWRQDLPVIQMQYVSNSWPLDTLIGSQFPLSSRCKAVGSAQSITRLVYAVRSDLNFVGGGKRRKVADRHRVMHPNTEAASYSTECLMCRAGNH
jgi:hypothetical protein